MTSQLLAVQPDRHRSRIHRLTYLVYPCAKWKSLFLLYICSLESVTGNETLLPARTIASS